MTPAPPLPLEQAQERLLALAEPLGSESLAVEDAPGRFLAGRPVARRSQPAADLSAMDGFAMGSADLTGPWRVIGESAAGHPFDRTLEPGEAVRISTGAILPRGAGAILIRENAALENETLQAAGEPTARHIRRAGFDFSEGDALIDPGVPLTPARIALLLASGNASVEIGRRPSLAIVESGDELAADPAHCALHQVPASNGAMLAAMASPLVSRVERIGPVPDRIDALLAALDGAEAADVLVTSGGASVGAHDLVRPALERWGATLDFWRVAIRPGKPLLVARRGRQLILGLPGNPVSSFVTAFLFLLPLLRRLGGSQRCIPLGLNLDLMTPLPATGERMEFVRANYGMGGVIPRDEQDSSALGSLAGANCLIRRPANAPPAKRGDDVIVLPFENGGLA